MSIRDGDYTESAERFTSDTSTRTYMVGDTRKTIRGHELTILHDDGLYRHLRFKSPDTSNYWFDLITWPGVLTVRGDFGDAYTFARITNMFEFFRGHQINPHYWSEKLDGGRGRVMKYSETLFRQAVWEHVRLYGQEHRGLAKAVQAHFFDRRSDFDISREDEAREALDAFKFTGEGYVGPFEFVDTWEWSFRDFDWTFLWACQAIVFGIARYDETKAASKTVVGAGVS